MANRRMTEHQLNGKGYYNQHPYNNKESRWCDLNEVPYARNGSVSYTHLTLPTTSKV